MVSLGRSPLGLRELKLTYRQTYIQSPSRSPLGLRELKLLVPLRSVVGLCRSPLGLRELKREVLTSNPFWTQVAARLGCVN